MDGAKILCPYLIASTENGQTGLADWFEGWPGWPGWPD
jgi:hypothetical protein